MSYLLEGILLDNSQMAAKIIILASLCTMIDGILYYINQKSDSNPRIVVPTECKKKLIEEHHSGIMSGHFSGPKIYKTMSRQWWLDHIHQDITDYTHNCPQCIIVTGAGHPQ